MVKKEEEYVHLDRCEHDEGDSDIIVGIDYPEEDDEFNEDDYDSVPTSKTAYDTDSNATLKEFHTQRYLKFIIPKYQ